MRQRIKRIIQNTPFYRFCRNWFAQRKHAKELVEWQRKGKPVPPPRIVKQNVLKAYAEMYDLKILVETGTYYGEMVAAMKDFFERVYSIELSDKLYEKAKRRFEGENNIEIIHGDSGVELGKLMHKLQDPTLFWLDSHYSAGVTAKGEKITPVYEELTHILSAPEQGHVIIIDDARDFGTNPDYPTVDEIKALIVSVGQDREIVVQDDSIRITPKK